MNKHGPGLKFLLLIISACFIFGCSREPVMARVNGEPITQKDIEPFMKHAGIKKDEKDHVYKAMQQEAISNLINEKLILHAAKKEKITVDKNEILKTYNNIVRTFPKEDDYLKKLKEKRMSKDMILKSIEGDLIKEKFKVILFRNLTVTDNELKDYYDKNIQVFRTLAQFRISMIKANNIEEAKKIKKEIEKGAGFEDMSRKYPAGHAGPAGGEIGWVTLDTFPSDIAKEIKKIKTGAAGEPIKGKEGYYIIKVHERKDEKVKSLEEVKENIRQILIGQKKTEEFHAWLKNARDNAKIEIFQK